jgi:hypothetical protein
LAAVEYAALQKIARGITLPLKENIVSSISPSNMKTDCYLEDLQQMLSSL